MYVFESFIWRRKRINRCLRVSSNFSILTLFVGFCPQSDIIRGHTYLSVISLMQAFAPGWDRLWRLEKKTRPNDSGTNGRIFSELVSHTMFRLLFGTRIFMNFREVELSRSRFWRIWSLSCSFTNSVMSEHGSKKIALIVLDIASAVIFSAPFRCLMSEVNCNR